MNRFSLFNFIDTEFDVSEDLYKETALLLNYISNFKRVENYSRGKPLTFTEHPYIKRHTEDPILWVFGCSHSHGIGLLASQSKFADILSRELKMPLRLVSKPGTSTHWSLRHLMNAEIQIGDIVVWQITTPNRHSGYENRAIKEVVLSQSTNRHLIEVCTDEQLFFNQLSSLNVGVQFLRSKNVQFVVTSLDSSLLNELKAEYTKYPEYCYAPEFNVDLGTDGLHYGEMSHKGLAFSLLNHIQYRHE